MLPTRLKRAVSDLTLDKVIAASAVRVNFLTLPGAVNILIMCGKPAACLSAGYATYWVNTAQISAGLTGAVIALPEEFGSHSHGSSVW